MESLRELQNKFDTKIKSLQQAMIQHGINNNNESETILLQEEDAINDLFYELEELEQMVETKSNQLNHTIQNSLSKNTNEQDVYQNTKYSANELLDTNLASYPLNAQMQMRKRIMYISVFLYILGMIGICIVLYIQTQSKPSKPIQPKKIRNKAKGQARYLYNRTQDTTKYVGKRALNFADKATNQGIKQGRKTYEGILDFMFGKEPKKETK